MCVRICYSNIFLKLVTLLSLFTVVNSTFYRGGTISWTADRSNNVNFHFRMSWEYGSNGCNVNASTGNYVTSLSGEKWQCTSGCSGFPTIEDNGYYCIGSSTEKNWEMGEKRFTYSMNTTVNKQFTIGYEGGNWMPLGYGGGGRWNIETKIDLRERSDTGSPNNSPVTATIPVYSLPQGCTTTIPVPVYDVDGDVIKCRWASGGECGDMCENVTSTLPSGTLNQRPCSLTIDAKVANGYTAGSYYLVALTVEDFTTSPITIDNMTVPINQALSSVPLQFLIYVENATTTCTGNPVFIGTPADGTEFIVPNATTWTQRVYVQGKSGNMPSSMTQSGPRGLTVSAFQPDDLGRPSVMYVDMSWTPTPEMNGINIACFLAEDDSGNPSEQRCFTLLTGYPDPCASNPCKNGGMCDVKFTNFTCTCPSGVFGNLCQHDIDECTQAPCENGGQCFNTVGDYKCFCRPGFAGQNCSDSDFCSTNPCQGRGDCIHNVTSFSCDCYYGYSGVTCQIDEDECTSNPCFNDGECTDLVGGYNCECPPQYTGENCELEIDFCDPSPCQNGGVCRRQKNGYVCDCPDDVIGLTCEIPIEQMCNGDQSYCTCHVNGEPVRVPIPDPVDDETYERDLRAGVIGYPIGLLVGVGCCAVFHYFVRPRCRNDRRNRKLSSSASSASLLSSSRSAVFPLAPSPPPSYSSEDYGMESKI